MTVYESYTVIQGPPPLKRHGWIGPKKRHRSALSLATLEKGHRVLARSQVINFRNNFKMSSLHCQCTEHMLASCDTPDSDWATLLVCVGVIFLILGHLLFVVQGKAT